MFSKSLGALALVLGLGLVGAAYWGGLGQRLACDAASPSLSSTETGGCCVTANEDESECCAGSCCPTKAQVAGKCCQEQGAEVTAAAEETTPKAPEGTAASEKSDQ